MLAQLPPWISAGGFALAANAGAVNAIGLLGFRQHTVSNLTGTASETGVALAQGQFSDAWQFLLIILSFLFGAILSGVIIDNAVLRLGRRYGVALSIEAGLLLLALWQLQQGEILGYCLAAAACGLQNAMVSTYSGAVVRTSHVTGLITDLGILLGAKLRGRPLDYQRLTLFGLILFGFVIGSIAGALGFLSAGFSALLAPAGLALGLALGYWAYWLAKRYAY